MKEEDYKKLRCCGPCPENTGIPIFHQEAYIDGVVPIQVAVGSPLLAKGPYYCSGSECGAWVDMGTLWIDPATGYKYTSKVKIPGIVEEEGHGFCGYICE